MPYRRQIHIHHRPTKHPKRSNHHHHKPKNAVTQHRISRRFYQVPHYLGFKEAFARQLASYNSKSPTPISLSHFLQWPVNRVDLAIHSKLREQHKYNQLELLSQNNQQPSLNLNRLNEQIYSAEYQAKLIENAQFLWIEIPTRISHAINQMNNLPYGLSNTPQFKLLSLWYSESLKDCISSIPPTTIEDERNFTRVLNNILHRHSNVIPVVSQAVLFNKDTIYSTTGGKPCKYLKKFLDEFYANRNVIRMLISSHISFHKPIDGFCGLIDLELDPIVTIRAAGQEAIDLTERTYGTAPEINIFYSHYNTHKIKDKTHPSLEYYQNREQIERERKESIENKMKSIDYYYQYQSDPQHLACIDGHLHHMSFELLKNSLRATCETHGHLKELPPITVSVGGGENEITIGISDFGGGIKPEHEEKLFSYLFTTAGPKAQEMLKRFDVEATYHHEMQLDPLGPTYRNTSHKRTMTDLSTKISIRTKAPLLSISASSLIASSDTTAADSKNVKEGTGGDIFLSPNTNDSGEGSAITVVPISGFGVGLGLSRLFANFNGGDLEIHSISGLGTDASIYLKNLTPHDNKHGPIKIGATTTGIEKEQKM